MSTDGYVGSNSARVSTMKLTRRHPLCWSNCKKSNASWLARDVSLGSKVISPLLAHWLGYTSASITHFSSSNVACLWLDVLVHA